MNQILLTGHQGYIGKHLSIALEAEGYKVKGFDYQPEFAGYWQFEFDRWFDVTEDYEAVIHLGGIRDSQSDDPIMLEANTVATSQLLGRVRDLASKPYFIFFSSGLVKEGVSLYAYSKRLAEQFVRIIAREYAILRIYNVFGGTEPVEVERQSVVKRLIDGNLKRLYGNLVRDYVHIDEVCKAVLYALKHRPKFSTQDVGTGFATDIGALASAVGQRPPFGDYRIDLKYPPPQRMVASAADMHYFPKDSLADYLATRVSKEMSVCEIQEAIRAE